MSADSQAQKPAADGTRPVSEAEFVTRPKRQVVFTMGGLMLALFLAALDQTVVTTALPRIIADLGGFDRFTWITTAYLVASTTVVPIVGRLSDIYGRKSFFLGGIIIFLIGSVLAGTSQSMDQLIIFRAVQGVGGGTIFALAFTTIGDLFPPRDRGKYQGLVSAVFGLSSVIGPTLGGFITDNFSWNWIFYVNVPLGLLVVILFIRFFPNPRVERVSRRLDYAGMALLVLAVIPLLIGLSLGGVQFEWFSLEIIGVLAFAAAMIVVFVAIERRAADPIMPLRIYANRVVSISLFATFITGFAMFGAIVFIPLFFQGVLGASATSSGSFLTPMMLGLVVAAALSGQALSRLGGHYRIQGLVGIAIMATGMALTSQMTAETSFGQAVLNIVITGAGLGITFPTFTIAVQNAVPANLLGSATSAIQFYRSIGGALGLAILGSFMANRFATGIRDALTPDIQAALPGDQLAAIADNPQALVNPAALESLRAAFASQGEQGQQMVTQLLDALREILASAITDVFVVVAVIMIVAFVATIFLTEIPLSGRQPKDGTQ